MQPTTAEVLAALDRDGFCVMPGVLDGPALAEVRQAFDGAIAESRRRGLSIYDPRIDPNPHNIRVNNLPDMDPVFVELLRHPAALPVVRARMGETAIVSNFTANVALPGAASMRLHSDQALVAPAPWAESWAMNMIWCLDDVRAENGGTLYVPGSHRFRDFSDLPEDPERLLRAFTAPAGSVIAMDGRLWHTSGINVTRDEKRAMLFAFYSRHFMRQQVNWDVTLSDATKARLDDDARALLGMGAMANLAFGVELVLRPGSELDDVRVV